MENKESFDPAAFAQSLFNILGTVSVSGPQNIHGMDVVLQGLEHLRNELASKQKQQEEI